MTIFEFLNKWAPEDPQKDYEFQDDLWAALSTTTGQHSATAMQVLTGIKGAELVLDSEDTYGRITFGPKGKSREVGITVTYSNDMDQGQGERDWLLLLKCLAEQALTTMK